MSSFAALYQLSFRHSSGSTWIPFTQAVSPETHEFVKKVFEKSGIDKNGSYLPKNLHPQHTLDPKGGLDESFAEARLVMGGAVEEVLRKTGNTPIIPPSGSIAVSLY